MIDFSLNLVLKSICKNHKDFALTGDKEKDIQTRKKLADIVDLQDLRNLCYFAFNGTFIVQKEIIIDTGEGEKDEKKV